MRMWLGSNKPRQSASKTNQRKQRKGGHGKVHKVNHEIVKDIDHRYYPDFDFFGLFYRGKRTIVSHWTNEEGQCQCCVAAAMLIDKL